MKKKLLYTIFNVLLFSLITAGQDFSIIIDAQQDAFYQNLTGPENGYVYLPSRSYLDEITPATQPDGDADISAKVWFAWDADYIYCYAEVVDDSVTASNSSRFENDCLELKFDPDPFNGTGTNTANSRITGIGLDMGFDPAGIDNLNGSGHLEDASGNDWVVTEDDYARRLTDNGYVVEFRIPFEYINEPEDNRFMVLRELDNGFGLGINIGDNDDVSRTDMIQWSAAHHDTVHSRAIGLGSAIFMPDNILKLAAVSLRDPSVVNDSADAWYNPPLVGVEEGEMIVNSYYLHQNYPNPFNPVTNIRFNLPHDVNVTLKIYNTLGQKVAELLSEELTAGEHTAEWNAEGFAGGIYFYQIRTDDFVQTKKLVLLK